MELVYLWVEKYKNIEKQGFNFSPRFECKFYDEYEKYIADDGEEKERLKENCELEIKDREHIENFFGENINVTAIVGENGSGKSTLIDILYNNPNLNKIVVYYNKVDNSFYYSNSNIKITIEANNLIELDDKVFEKIHINFHDICNYKNFEVSVLNNLDEELSLFNYKPYKLCFTIYNSKITDLLEEYKYEIIDSINEWKGPEEKKYSDTSLDEYKLFFELNNFFKETKDLFLLFLIFDYIKSGGADFFYIGNIFNEYKDEYEDEYEDEIIPYSPSNGFSDRGIKKFFLKEEAYPYQEDKDRECLKNFFEDEDFLKKYTHESTKINNESVSLFIEKILKLGVEDIFDFTIEDKNKVSNKMLSDGEKQSILLLLSISKELKKLENDNIFIFLDEIELTYHPNWQKQVINILIKFFKENYSHLKVHFIITTHSPFLLSDLPKENIIFLKDGKKDVGIKKQTFGANIHTLLSDSFFMEGGLMGEFAKQKINKIIDFFNNKNEIYKDDKEKLLKIINTIGEPFLKDKLLFMYNEKYPKTKEEEIAELEDKLKRLKNG